MVFLKSRDPHYPCTEWSWLTTKLGTVHCLMVKLSSCLLPEFSYTFLLLCLSMLGSILHCDRRYTLPCVKTTQTQDTPSLLSHQVSACAHLSCWCFQEWLMSSTTHPLLFCSVECNSWQWLPWKAEKRVFPGKRAANREKSILKSVDFQNIPQDSF